MRLASDLEVSLQALEQEHPQNQNEGWSKVHRLTLKCDFRIPKDADDEALLMWSYMLADLFAGGIAAFLKDVVANDGDISSLASRLSRFYEPPSPKTPSDTS